MPYTKEWCEPELFIEVNNVEVYNTYPDEEDIDFPDDYCFAIYPQAGDSGFVDFHIEPWEFDIRQLARWVGEEFEGYFRIREKERIIRKLVEKGYLTKQGVVDDPENAPKYVDYEAAEKAGQEKLFDYQGE